MSDILKMNLQFLQTSPITDTEGLFIFETGYSLWNMTVPSVENTSSIILNFTGSSRKPRQIWHNWSACWYLNVNNIHMFGYACSNKFSTVWSIWIPAKLFNITSWRTTSKCGIFLYFLGGKLYSHVFYVSTPYFKGRNKKY